MKLTLSNSNDDMIVVEVRRDMLLSELKTLFAWETNSPVNDLSLYHKGSPLVQEGLDLRSHGIADGDMVVFRKMPRRKGSPPYRCNRTPRIASPNSPKASVSPKRTASNDPAQIRNLLLSNPNHMAALKENNPKLYNALKSGKLEEFASVLAAQLEERERLERKRMQLLQAHPFDIEAQRLIAEDIRRKNIEANMEAALEHNPESFGVVIMLFINCLVNGYPVKAFVDSGAQTTIMSVKCAERVNIMRLVDTRWSGVARGVGVQRIIGRVHMVDVVIEKDHLTTSFSVIEEQAMDMLLGLDMLKRHQCCIDLKKNVLRIGTTGTETPFLTESELPDFVNVSPTSSGSKRPKSSKKKPNER
ncbi:protein DDI1 homolog 2-like isoform X1 [Cimex lectularius]|uniref:Uncharacterized protein n=1 Tax=Cimex lectularius TaxID=79782 RepID=A0A8I6S3B0_CIMLE|nr:protein DDI1 homolog 2-like isoform X1 [Cimex lectularius]